MFNNTLKGVKDEVRSIVGDQRASWLTDAYLNPMVNHVYRLQILYLSDSCSPYITAARIALNLRAGTIDLTQLQSAANQAFYGLFNPFHDGVDWKPADAPVSAFQQARQTIKLPDVEPNMGQAQCTLWWEWRSWIVYLTPLGFPIDLRIRGEYIPPPLLKDEDPVVVHPLLGPVLAEDVAACATRERANPGQMQAFKLTATDSLDDIANQLVRAQQGPTVRVGRADRRGARGWRGWSCWPC